jgi:hypothetical protein
VHRRLGLDSKEKRLINGIPVTDPVTTLIDISRDASPSRLEGAIREADRLDIVDPESLREALDSSPRRPGVGRLRSLLDSETFSLADSELERRFLRLVLSAGLPMPKTRR